jgi:hypothetical protein
VKRNVWSAKIAIFSAMAKTESNTWRQMHFYLARSTVDARHLLKRQIASEERGDAKLPSLSPRMHMRSWGQASPRSLRCQARSGEELPAVARRGVTGGERRERRGATSGARRARGGERPTGPDGYAARSGRRYRTCMRVKVRKHRELPPLLFIGSHDNAEEQGRPAQSSSSRWRSASVLFEIPSAAKRGGWCCGLSPPRRLPRRRRIQSRGAWGLVQLSSSPDGRGWAGQRVRGEPLTEGPRGWGRSSCGNMVAAGADWKGKLQ